MGLTAKIEAIKKAIIINKPDEEDPVDVLAKVGGLDIAGMAGVYLGGAALQIPVLIDGFISGVAALVAAAICPASVDYMIASHVSKEPAAHLILEKLGKKQYFMRICVWEKAPVPLRSARFWTWERLFIIP